MVFGENRGDYPGDSPRRTLPGSLRERRADASKAPVYQEMQELDAVADASTRRRLRSDSRVPVPAESEPTSACESEKWVPRRNTLEVNTGHYGESDSRVKWPGGIGASSEMALARVWI
jgi:hypothetical protein